MSRVNADACISVDELSADAGRAHDLLRGVIARLRGHMDPRAVAAVLEMTQEAAATVESLTDKLGHMRTTAFELAREAQKSA